MAPVAEEMSLNILQDLGLSSAASRRCGEEGQCSRFC